MKYKIIAPSLFIIASFVCVNGANAQSFGSFTSAQSAQNKANIEGNRVTTIIYDTPIKAPPIEQEKQSEAPKTIETKQVLPPQPEILPQQITIIEKPVENSNPKISNEIKPIGHGIVNSTNSQTEVKKRSLFPFGKKDRASKKNIFVKSEKPPLRAHENTSPEYMANRGPVKAIYQDTKNAIIHDAPQALANNLPWVDKDRKNQPTDVVLKNVTDKLARANASDPEWVKPARDQLFELSRKLETLPNAPQYKEEYQEQQSQQDPNSRAFKPRPVWPGSKISYEPQNRPITITSDGVEGNNPKLLIAQNMEMPQEAAKNLPINDEIEKPKPEKKATKPVKRVKTGSSKKSAAKCSCSLRAHK